MASAYNAYHSAASSTSQYTPTALGRWSCIVTPLPAVDKIKALHVYDFDNTLFKTPLPNPQIWSPATVNKLANQNLFINGGWWHDSRILAATGQGLDKEQPRAWQGWWNEQVVELVRLTMRQPDALCVLLTGRSEAGFAQLIKKMVASKELEFDLVGLKPSVSPDNQHFHSTMHFKQLFLNALMETYAQANEIRIYEDRPKHTAGFRDFFAEYNRRQTYAPTRGALPAHVIQVAHLWTKLDPVVEVTEVLQMVQEHNAAMEKLPSDKRRHPLSIEKSVAFTGYMIDVSDTDRLKALFQFPLALSRDIKFHGDSVVICPRLCPEDLLQKMGGLGCKMMWETVAKGCFDNGVWAARVRPVPSNATYYTENDPIVILAIKRGFRAVDACKVTDWLPLPPEQTFIFETTVGERASLTIEGDGQPGGEQGGMFFNKSMKRSQGGDEYHTSHNESRGYHTSARGAARSSSRGRGGPRSSYRGGSRGSRGRAGGRGGARHYRSLDDVDPPRSAYGAFGPRFDADSAYQPPSQAGGGGASLPSAPGRAVTQRLGKESRGPYSRPRGGVSATTNDTDLQDYY